MLFQPSRLEDGKAAYGRVSRDQFGAVIVVIFALLGKYSIVHISISGIVQCIKYDLDVITFSFQAISTINGKDACGRVLHDQVGVVILVLYAFLGKC
ncbi:hypothetical protein VNO78_22774 [Psophocarpus tetragonolobus]|uniref:Uncharacterized protein n=1 Tax=Psophocarpus tetragonolobus TaxID=3891 RepID=A0AAN9XCK7_PSOTE